MCMGIQQQLAAFEAALSRGRHGATMGPLLQLVRLHVSGHQGQEDALAAARKRFIESVAPDRPGGEDEAAAEFGRALAGARREVGPLKNEYQVCAHWLDHYASVLTQTEGFSRGLGGVAQRLLLRELLASARAGHSRTVRVDQGTLAVRTNKTQPKISAILSRLRDLGFVRVVRQHGPNHAATLELLLPLALVPVSVHLPAGRQGAGGFTDTGTDAPCSHPVFQASALGAGAGETYQALRSVTGTGVAASDADPLTRTGGTPVELARSQHKHPSTVRRHLTVLKAVGLAVNQDGRWTAVANDLDVVAAQHGFSDSRPRRARDQAHRRQRFYAEQALWEDEPGGSAYRLVEVGETVVVVRSKTGEVVVQVEEPWMLGRLELARAERVPPAGTDTQIRRGSVATRRSGGSGWLHQLQHHLR